MNKRSIITSIAALAVGVAALTGCSSDSDPAHSYVTPADTKTVAKQIDQLEGTGVKVPEKRDLKITLADGQDAAKWNVAVADPSFAEVGKADHNVVTIHPLKALGEDDDPVQVTLTSPDGAVTTFNLTITEGAN